MRISIIVPDSMVYIDGKAVEIDMPESVSKYRAIQWNEKNNNAGHIELENGENIVIDEIAFQDFSDIVDAAITKISGTNEFEFSVTKESIGDFNLFRVFAEKSGATSIAGDQKDIQRNIGSIRVSMVTKGSRLYESINNNFQPITMNVGDFNIDLPDMKADDSYKVTALADETEYHCISKKDLTPYQYERVKMSAGQSISVPAGKNLFIGGGETSLGVGPTLVASSDSNRVLSATSGNVFGLIF